MALLNIFKRGKNENERERKVIEKQRAIAKKQPKVLAKLKQQAKQGVSKKTQVKKVSDTKKDVVVKPETKKVRKGSAKTAHKILKAPQITEKATFLQDIGQYVFKVQSIATKPEIKKSVEEFYGVNVLSVRIINVPRKRKRLGRTQGWKEGYKKAMVKIKQGETIDLLPH